MQSWITFRPDTSVLVLVSSRAAFLEGLLSILLLGLVLGFGCSGQYCLWHLGPGILGLCGHWRRVGEHGRAAVRGHLHTASLGFIMHTQSASKHTSNTSCQTDAATVSKLPWPDKICCKIQTTAHMHELCLPTQDAMVQHCLRGMHTSRL